MQKASTPDQYAVHVIYTNKERYMKELKSIARRVVFYLRRLQHGKLTKSEPTKITRCPVIKKTSSRLFF